MFSDDDLVVITLTNQPTNKIFGLIQTGERITDKARLHKSYRQFIFFTHHIKTRFSRGSSRC
jgi:hypothetical protein